MSETTSNRKIVYIFQTDGKTIHAAQCYKSRALTEMIDLIPEIESFEQKCFIIKGLLQS